MVLVLQITRASGNGILSKPADKIVRAYLTSCFRTLTKDEKGPWVNSSSAWYSGNDYTVRVRDLTGKIRVS